MVLISPSLLSADFLRLAEEIAAVEAAGADRLHIDVMDGRFVPNLTLGPPIIRAIKRAATIPLDVHLMIDEPECYIDEYIGSGADVLTIHVESCIHLERAIRRIKEGCLAGVALNPSTSEEALTYVIEEIDQVLVMSVNPGFSGQRFINSSLKKISAIKAMIDAAKNQKCVIAIDGGINDLTAKEAMRAGAGCLVAGSFVFGSDDYSRAISQLRAPGF